jgi:hypothetical protein
MSLPPHGTSFEQLAAKQGQVAETIVMLQIFEQDIKQRLASHLNPRRRLYQPREPAIIGGAAIGGANCRPSR